MKTVIRLVILFLVYFNHLSLFSQESTNNARFQLIKKTDKIYKLDSSQNKVNKIEIADRIVQFQYLEDNKEKYKKLPKASIEFDSNDEQEDRILSDRNNPYPKKMFEYKNLDNNGLTVKEITVYYNTDNDVSRTELKKSKLFNKKGELIRTFQNGIDYVVPSPDGNYFIATRTGENPSDTLFVYNINGENINKIFFPRSTFKFTSQSTEIMISDDMGKFSLYKIKGDSPLFEIITNKVLNHGYISNFIDISNANLFLFSTFLPTKDLLLVNREGVIKWEKRNNYIYNAFNIPNNNLLVTYSKSDSENSAGTIELINLQSGFVYDSIQNCQLIDSYNSKILVKKFNKYIEYEIH